MRLIRVLLHMSLANSINTTRLNREILIIILKRMPADDIIIPFESLFASPVVRCRKDDNNKNVDDTESRKFNIDYRKLSDINQYLRYPIPVTDEILANINIMNYVYLISRYFQIGMKLKDIAKTAFININDCFPFKRVNFSLSGIRLCFRGP